MDGTQNQKDVFWMDDPRVLLDSYLKFVPTQTMTRNQQFNAITLFSVYFFILILIFGKTVYWLYIPVVIICLITVAHFIKDDKHVNEDFSVNSEVGFMDTNGDIRFSRVTGDLSKNNEVSYSCRKPTYDNPFMNPSVSEFNTRVPSACNTDDDNIDNTITKAFNKDLYMDVDDVFSKKNSQRQYYTVPDTGIPNDQTAFANWLYRSPTTCKEDQERCLRYEDLRYKR